jgi:formate C-acetyltransferase
MREKYFASRPCITAERLVLQTEAYKRFAGDAAPVFRAEVVRYILEHMTTLIMEDELIVGTPTNRYRGANLHPEFQSAEKFYLHDIDEFPVRKCDPYDIAPEDREQIVRILNEYWIGRSMEDEAGRVLPPDIEKARREDIISVGLRNGVSGETTCDHEKLLRVGLRGYMDECRARIAATQSMSADDQRKIDFWNACIIQCEGLIAYATAWRRRPSARRRPAKIPRAAPSFSRSPKTAASSPKTRRRPSGRLCSLRGSCMSASTSRSAPRPAASAALTSTCGPSMRRTSSSIGLSKPAGRWSCSSASI